MLSSESSDLGQKKQERGCPNIGQWLINVDHFPIQFAMSWRYTDDTASPFFQTQLHLCPHLTTLLCRSVLWALDRESFNNIAPCLSVLPVGTPSIVSFQTHVFGTCNFVYCVL